MRSECRQWCHRYTRWPHHHEVTVLSQNDVPMWGNYDVSMISELWHHMYDLFVRSLWYEFTTSPWGHSVVRVRCHKYMRWLHYHQVTVSSQCDVTDTRDDNIILWDHFDIKIMTSPVWDFCEVTVIQVGHITLRSQCCHSMMSQVFKVTRSPWGHSAVTWRC